MDKMRWTMVVVALLISTQVVIATCSTSAIGTVVLNNCPMEVHDLGVNSTLTINFVDTTLQLPTTTLTTRAFQLDGHPVRIPMGVIKIPKGVNATVYFQNKASIVSNLHTHGLHIRGGKNADGTVSDDVSVEVAGGTTQMYNYYIPSDHAGGIHWIHAHVHMKTEIQVQGGALGMLVVEDDPTGLEIPMQIIQADTYELIMAHFNPARYNAALNRQGYSMTPNINTPFYTVNGFSNPILQIKQGKWTRLRTLHASPSDPLYMTIPNVTTCNFVLLAKDGVYLPSGPRVLQPLTDMFYTHASRLDWLIKCDSPVGTTMQFKTDYAAAPAPPAGTPTQIDLNIFKIQVIARDANVAVDAWFPSFTPCLPAYVQDMTGLTANQYSNFDLTFVGPPPPGQPGTGDTINGQSFSGFDPSDALLNLTVGTVQQFTYNGGGHPFHLHVYPMQYQADSLNGWHKKGDIVDVVFGTPNPIVLRARVDQHIGLVVLHCHILGHEDGGLMGMFETYPNQSDLVYQGVRPAEVWGQETCPSVITLGLDNGVTQAPTSAAAGLSSSYFAMMSICLCILLL